MISWPVAAALLAVTNIVAYLLGIHTGTQRANKYREQYKDSDVSELIPYYDEDGNHTGYMTEWYSGEHLGLSSYDAWNKIAKPGRKNDRSD